jgi:hypothetical protein
MPGIAQYTKTGPRTYSPASGTTVKGGQLVDAVNVAPALTNVGRIQPSAAGSTVCLGVALTDAIAPEQVNTSPTTDATTGRPVIDMFSAPTTVAVADGGIIVPVTYAANAVFGQALIAAALGTVTPAGATPDARTIVGWCRQPGGVVVGTNPVGLMKTV